MLAFDDLLEAMLRDLEVPIPRRTEPASTSPTRLMTAHCQNFRPACR
jgi:hypothetical protein